MVIYSMNELERRGRRAGAIRAIYRSGPSGDLWMYTVVYPNGLPERVKGLDALGVRVDEIIKEHLNG